MCQLDPFIIAVWIPVRNSHQIVVMCNRIQGFDKFSFTSLVVDFLTPCDVFFNAECLFVFCTSQGILKVRYLVESYNIKRLVYKVT
jgi:hypothetical protein